MSGEQEQKEPWDFQPEEGGAEQGGQQEPQARRIQPPGGGEGGEEGGEMEPTYPEPQAMRQQASTGGEAGGGEAGGGFWGKLGKVLVPVLVEIGVVLMKRASQSGFLPEEEIRQIEERQGFRLQP